MKENLYYKRFIFINKFKFTFKIQIQKMSLVKTKAGNYNLMKRNPKQNDRREEND